MYEPPSTTITPADEKVTLPFVLVVPVIFVSESQLVVNVVGTVTDESHSSAMTVSPDGATQP